MKNKVTENGLSGVLRSEGAGERSETASERMSTPDSGGVDSSPSIVRRRRWSAAEKQRVLRLAEACTPGTSEIGSLLRREGIYYATLSKWRQQQAKGSFAGNGPARGPKPQQPSLADFRALQKENQRLLTQLDEARMCLELQKKASEILGIRLSPQPNSLKDL